MSDSDEENIEEVQCAKDDNIETHPLFWDAIPTNPENNPAFEALQAIDEELSPEERAQGLKTNGNNKLKLALSDKADSLAKRNLLREAVKFYTDGLALACDSAELNSILCSNRAQAHSLLGNWRNTLEDSQRAIKHDEKNIKAYFRGARAALKLKKSTLALQICNDGLKLEKSKELESILKEAEAALAADEKLREKQKAEEEAARLPFQKLARTITSRGYKITRPASSHLRKIVQEEDGSLTWPVIFMIPESMQEDVVERFNEEDLFDEHLDLMFGPGAPPLEWDTAGEYARDKLELYYLINSGATVTEDQMTELLRGRWPDGVPEGSPAQYGKNAAKWCKVDPRRTLREVMLSPGHVVPFTPVFFVLAKGTEYRRRFLQGTAR